MNEMNNTTKGKKRFRLSAKRLFLTYSQTDPELSKEYLIQELYNKIDNIQDYVVGAELHKDGGTHIHAILIAKTKFDIRQADRLDVAFNGKTFHGNYKAVKLYNRAVEYVCKEKDYITSLDNIKDGKIVSLEQQMLEMYKEKGVKDTLLHYVEKHPKQAFGARGIVNVKKMFSLLDTLRGAEERQQSAPLSIEHFRKTEEIQSWIDNGCQPTGVLVGPAGCGKTLFGKALAEHLRLKMLAIKHPDALNSLKEEHGMLFLDDAHLTKMDHQQLLALLESNDNSQIRVLYNVVVKKAGLVQLVALNPDALAQLKHVLMLPQFLRRIRILPVDKDFIVNVNVNINVHQHTHVHNNKDVMQRNLDILQSI